MGQKRSKISCGDHATNKLLHDTEAILELREALADGEVFYLSANEDEGSILYHVVRLSSDRLNDRQRTITGRNFAFVLLELLGKMPKKVCKSCPQKGEQPLTAFSVDLVRPDGINDYCLACYRANYHASVADRKGLPKKATATNGVHKSNGNFSNRNAPLTNDRK